MYLASELSNENSKIYATEKSSYLTVALCPVVDLGPIMGLNSTFYWAAQHLLWAVFAAPVA